MPPLRTGDNIFQFFVLTNYRKDCIINNDENTCSIKR